MSSGALQIHPCDLRPFVTTGLTLQVCGALGVRVAGQAGCCHECVLDFIPAGQRICGVHEILKGTPDPRMVRTPGFRVTLRPRASVAL